MNTLALLAGLVTYVVVGTVCGLMVLGIGFMPEPTRTIYGHVVLFGPFIPTGLVVGYLARSNALALAGAVALIAFAGFLVLAPGPVPFIVREVVAPWVPAVQASYQVAWFLAVCVLAAWLGRTVRSAGAGSKKSSPLAQSKHGV